MLAGIVVRGGSFVRVGVQNIFNVFCSLWGLRLATTPQAPSVVLKLLVEYPASVCDDTRVEVLSFSSEFNQGDSQSVSDETDRSRQLVNRVIQGDAGALAELFAMYRQRLWRMVNFRLHRLLQGKVDADDVLQEAYLNATKRVDSFLQDASRSVFIWFRLIVGQTLVDVHRRHLGAKSRDAGREFSIHSGFSAESTSFSVSYHLLGHLTSPSQAAMKAELSQQLDTALNDMNDIDREVLALRHFEELTNVETAQVLDISQQAASVRYIRALSRLKDVVSAIPGFLEDRPELIE